MDHTVYIFLKLYLFWDLDPPTSYNSFILVAEYNSWHEYARCGFDPWIGKIPWSRKCQPAQAFLPGKFHGQRSLVDHSPWGQWDMAEWLSARTHPHKRRITHREKVMRGCSRESSEDAVLTDWIDVTTSQRKNADRHQKLNARKGKALIFPGVS